jgi:5-methyltetrahydropteroyltriglutamate--homocysteine methyltransferase
VVRQGRERCLPWVRSYRPPPKIIPLYKQLLIELKAAGAKWVQIDEPVLVLDAGLQFGSAYVELSPVVPRSS